MAADITTLAGYNVILQSFAKQADLAEAFGEDLINAAIEEALTEVVLKGDPTLHYLKTNILINLAGSGDDIYAILPDRYLTLAGNVMRVKMTDGTTYKLVQIVRGRGEFSTNQFDDRRTATIDGKRIQFNPGASDVLGIF